MWGTIATLLHASLLLLPTVLCAAGGGPAKDRMIAPVRMDTRGANAIHFYVLV